MDRSPLSVFIDTSIHVRKGFQYDAGSFARLRRYAAGGAVRVLETTVDAGEIRGAIRRAARASFGLVRRLLRQSRALDSELSEVKELSESAIADRLMRKYDEYRSAVGIESLDVKNADTAVVFKRYFDGVAPFEPLLPLTDVSNPRKKRKRKRAEFPDAFILATLEAWCERSMEPIYVVSGDIGLINATKGVDRLIGLESLEALFEILVRNEQERTIAEAALKWLGESKEEVDERLATVFCGLGFFLADQNGDVEDIEVEDIEHGEASIVEIVRDEASGAANVSISLPIEVTFTAEATFDDMDTAIYDSEDKAAYAWQTKRLKLRTSANTRAEVVLSATSGASIRTPPSLAVALSLTKVRLEDSDIAVNVEESDETDDFVGFDADSWWDQYGGR